jgi:hypothetical protein
MKLTWLFAFPLIFVSLVGSALAQGSPFHADSILNSLQSFTASTIPPNGDLNPYGVAFVPAGFPFGGATATGNLLVANFNNSGNLQGTGATIISISPTGQQSLFATSSQIGLDTALGVLTQGFVVVGNLPVTYPPPPGSPTPGTGVLQFFDRSGNLVLTLSDPTLDSPWDLAINDQGSQAQIFVSNVLSGTVTRVNVSISNNKIKVLMTRIGSGYKHQPNAAAVVVGPTGLAYDRDHDTLYVASTDDNTIFAIPDAGDRTSDANTGFVVFADPDQQHLHGPLGLVLTPKGNLITANGDAVFAGGTQNDLVEFTPHGNLVATYQLDAGPPGGAFGIAITSSQGSVRFAAVDDDLNTVTVWTLHPDN